MTVENIKVFDEKGELGIAVYKARKRGTEDWKLLYMWADYNASMYVDEKTGEFVSKGYYMYVYLGNHISNMISYDPQGMLGQILLGRAEKKTRDGLEKHASLLAYWGADVLKELFSDIEVDLSKGVHLKLFNAHRGNIFPTNFIWESFPTYLFKPFWNPEKWDRLPEDNEFVCLASDSKV